MRSEKGEGRHSYPTFIYSTKIPMCNNFLHPESNAINPIFSPMTLFPECALPMFIFLSSLRREIFLQLL